jgi:hypothetical protein
MALAKFRKVYDKNGSGRFVVSEGIAPSEYLLPHEELPTLYSDMEDDRFEVVISKGTLLGLVTDDNGDSRIVPAGYDTTGWDNLAAGGSANAATVIGAAQYDLYRPFDKGTSQGAGWITHGYVEWPLIEAGTDAGSFSNDNIKAGDLVGSDNRGRPVKHSGADSVVGKVIAVEKFATNFDDGMLSYMQLSSDPGALREVYSLTKEGPYKGRLGIRANLDVARVVGAFRVNLTL